MLDLFAKKNWKKQIKQRLELKMYSRENGINDMLNQKDKIIQMAI